MIGYVARTVLLESSRRKIFLVVPFVTIGFLGLYAFAVNMVFDNVGGIDDAGIEGRVFAGATLLGLSMFATLFLGAVLTAFLTFSTIRGDAEQGILQPAIVRPPGRRTWLIGRYLGAASIGCTYALMLFLSCVLLTATIGDWTPDRIVEPAFQLVGGVAIIGLISTFGSLFLSATANGTTVLMLFGTGLISGLMEQIGDGLNSPTLVTLGHGGAMLLPFEVLYQGALRALTADTTGLTGFVVRLGPFGGGRAMSALGYAWVIGFCAVMAFTTIRLFERRDV